MRYAELHCKTNFSFLEGAAHADELVARAAELGYAALAVTDRQSLAGVVRAHAAIRDLTAAGGPPLKLIIGAEIHPADSLPLVLWATDRASYGRLSRLITVGRRRAEKGHCLLTLDDVAQHSAGLLAGVLPTITLPLPLGEGRGEGGVGSFNGEPQATTSSNVAYAFGYALNDGTLQAAQLLRDIFPDRAYLLAELLRGPDDEAKLAQLIALSQQTKLPLIAAGDVHYHVPARQPLHEVLTATRLGTTVDRLAEHRFANAQRHLRPIEEIAAAFAAAPGALRRTLEIAARCSFSLDELRYEYPEELAPAGLSPAKHLVNLTWQGAREHYPGGIPEKVRRLIEHELALIGELRYEAYFLTVWDLVRYARSRDILCQGRGSAANSAVCYCLGVTSVNPGEQEVLFERFVSRERNEAPDIDVDFEHERREEVLQYIYDKYGRERAGMTAVVITYRTKSAIRDVGKALGLSLDRVDAIAKNAEGRELDGHAADKGDKHEHPQEPVGCISAAQCTSERGQGSGFRHSEGTRGSVDGGQRSEVRGQPVGCISAAQCTDQPPIHHSSFIIHHSLPLAPSPTPPLSPTPVQTLALRCAQAGFDPQSPLGLRFLHLVTELVGFPRHLSQHVGGMVITQGPLCELSPIENAAMPGRTVIEWDKDDLDELGILKVDCLCLGMLTAIRKCFDLIHQPSFNGEPQATMLLASADAFGYSLNDASALNAREKLTLASIPQDDPEVYDMICRADTVGVFQIESRAQMSMLPRLKPRKYYDLVIEVAIVRPGPIQGNMVHPYLRRRQGEAVPPYPTAEIEKVLERTLGVPLFQEQAMQLAVVAAGFTPGEADQLRRAMGAWRRPGVIDQFRKKLILGMTERGLTSEFAEQVFNQIRGFGEYGFPESHAASFALLVYVSAWLKHYYPAAFCAGILNSQPMGFYAPAQLIRDAQQHGVRVLPVDVNHSAWDCTLEDPPPVGCISAAQCTSERVQGSGFGVQETEPVGCISAAQCTGEEARVQRSEVGKKQIHNSAFIIHNLPLLRLGLRILTGLSKAAAETIAAARQAGSFLSVDDFARRTRLNQAIIARLAEADAFSSLQLGRRAALWHALAQDNRLRDMPLLAPLDDEEPQAAELPPMPPFEQVFADYRTAGLSLKAHPLSFFREQLDDLRVMPAGDLKNVRNGRHIRVAGIVLVRQRPGTARGITFVTLEDESGQANLVIRPNIWERFYPVARRSPAWIAHGVLESHDSVIHLVVSRLEDLSARLGDLRIHSRDFH